MFETVTLTLLGGFGETIKVFIWTLVFSIPLGLVVCFGSMSRFTPLRLATRGFVWIIRGTPLMLQLIIIFYGPGLMFDLPAMPRITATLVAFSINYACYFSEIYRGGIESIPKGQYEAGQVLGLTKAQVCPHYQKVKDYYLDGQRLFEDITYGDSMGNTFFALPDGSYILSENGMETLYGEAYRIRNGILELVCVNGNSMELSMLY